MGCRCEVGAAVGGPWRTDPGSVRVGLPPSARGQRLATYPLQSRAARAAHLIAALGVMPAMSAKDGCRDLTGEGEQGGAAGLAGMAAACDEFVADLFGGHVGAGVASGEQPVGAAGGAGGEPAAGLL